MYINAKWFAEISKERSISIFFFPSSLFPRNFTFYRDTYSTALFNRSSK